MADVQPVKDAAKLIWSMGDYRELAQMYEPAAVALVDACAVGPGMELLDVAAGTGNVAVAAARRGARVVASDFTTRMIELGRDRSAAEGLDIDWLEADAEDLPFEVDRFDVVASSFGAMFAPRPQIAAAELFRVVRAGGTVGMANMTPQGYLGRLIAIATSYAPAPPEGTPRPLLWGEAEVVRDRLKDLTGSVDIQPRTVTLRFGSVQAVLDFHGRFNGPLIALQSTLPPGRYQALLGELAELTKEFNQASDGSVRIESAYLLVVARKP